MKPRQFIVFLLGIALPMAIAAQGPQSEQFSYQGRLLEHGVPANGHYDLRFTLHTDEVLNSPSASAVELSAWPVVDGLVIAELGFPGQFDGRQRWLQMEVDGDVILPRQPVLASPVAQFALDTDLRGEITGFGRANRVTGARVDAQADTLVRRDGAGAIEASVLRGDVQGNADSASFASQAATADQALHADHADSADVATTITSPLGGDVVGPQSATAIAPSAVTGAKIADGQVVRALNGLRDDVTLAGSGTVSISSSGNALQIQGIGISGVSAGAGLTGGGSAGTVPLAVSFGGNGGAVSVARSDHNHYGQVWTGAGNGLRVSANSPTGRAIEGSSTTLTDFNGAGIAGLVLNAAAQSVGVYGATTSANPESAGVFGQTTVAGGSRGVWGWASGAGNVAVQGTAASGDAQAGRFNGNVQVTGALSKGGGSFKIDHPLDPENQYLYHSFVESPDMKNIYDGVARLDARGMAVVEMAEWFEALNSDFRYQLTAMDAPMPGLYVAEAMHEGRFVVAGGVAGARVSWMVTGIRQDAWAQANRIPVEEPKPASARGRYLHPGAHGLPASRGIDAEPGARAIASGG